MRIGTGKSPGLRELRGWMRIGMGKSPGLRELRGWAGHALDCIFLRFLSFVLFCLISTFPFVRRIRVTGDRVAQV